MQPTGLNEDRLAIALNPLNKDPVHKVLHRNEDLRNRASAPQYDLPAPAQAKHTVKLKERKKVIVWTVIYHSL